MTRRTALRRGAGAICGVAVGACHGQLALAQDDVAARAEALAQAPVFNEYRYGHMVQEYFVHRVRKIARQRQRARAAIRTVEQVLDLRDEVRAKLQTCYGPFPQRTPLRPRITGSVEREHYTIERLIYESRPNYLVTANVYVPKSVEGPRPAVLATCGHSNDGKAYAAYQEFSRNLARQGYVVLIYDPPSQGERLEYPDSEPGPRVRLGVHSHNQAGNQLTLVGESFALWEAWDGIRGLDYLVTRPDVDAQRLGVTGNSGGGTQTSHLAALDERFSMVAPNCFVTRFLRNLENEEPTDAEQIMPGALDQQLDMADFFIAHLPRPTLLSGERNDFFDVRGLRETYRELKRLYAILGKQDDVELYVGPNTHGFHRPARENMYRFFNQHAQVDGSPAEPELPPEPEEVLRATPQGQVHLLGSRRTFDFTRQKANDWAARRDRLAGQQLVEAVGQSLALPERHGAPAYRVMRARRIWNSPSLTDYGFVVETEPRMVAMLHAIPRSGPQYHFPRGQRATLYIPHRSSLKEMITGQAPHPADEPIRFALDVRGMGQLTARTHKDSGDDFFDPYHSDYMYANHGLMLREPYAGRRVHDALCVLDLFQAHGYREIHLVGRGMGAITATFAALLHPLVNRVTLHNALLSYHELTQDPRYTWPLSAMVFDVLKTYDLPDCLRHLAAEKHLALVAPWTSRMQPWPAEQLPAHLKSLGLDEVPIGASENKA
jgi:dienelactone hydrolase